MKWNIIKYRGVDIICSIIGYTINLDGRMLIYDTLPEAHRRINEWKKTRGTNQN